MKITVSAHIQASVQSVWLAYITPQAITQWNAASEDWHTPSARVDLRVGGEFYARMEAKDGSMGFDFIGHYTQIIPEQLLAYTFGGREARITFAPDEAGTLVTIIFDSENEHPVEMQQTGWQSILNNFKRFVESSQ